MDRNSPVHDGLIGWVMSLSARRAWIEIHHQGDARRPESVALRKESVDRNLLPKSVTARDTVALRKESVDRNGIRVLPRSVMWLSLSARRAWIEIRWICRNNQRRLSLSARRAWIEMPKIHPGTSTDHHRRSPQGERG